MVDGKYPTPKSLIKNEMDTLFTISTIQPIQESYQKLSSDAYEYYQILRIYKKKKLPCFNFESSIPILFKNKLVEINFGARIKLRDNAYEQVTYYLAICDPDTKKLIRYFHFDYAISGSVKKNPKPIYHLQFCADLPPALQSKGYVLDYPDIDYPRILSLPMSLALLLNLIFMEFYTEEFASIIKRPEWNSLVKANEELMLCPYYNSCNEDMVNVRPITDNCFINHRYYSYA